MMNDKKSPVQKFLEGKGFYIALALCVAGTGTAAWLAVNRTIDDIDDQNQKILESRPQTEDFTDPGEVDAEQNGVTISSEGEDSSSDASSSQQPAAQPSGGSASSVPQNSSALQFSLPVAGEKLNPYSDGKLVKDCKVRLIRQGIVVYDGQLGSLKRFQNDAKEVSSGYECGLTIMNFNDIKEGDLIEAYADQEVPQN